VESDADCAAAAARRGYAVVRDDLNAALSLPSDTFDVVVSNQVIEHLYDTEAFLDEAVRILKPGGRLVISTENPASWHNIGALVIGWQCFSLSNVSRRKSGVGNPLSLAPSPDGWAFPMQHHRLFTPKALAELFSLCGLEDVRVAGAGYHPLSPVLGRFDVTHAHLITASGTKPAA
jgi:SAM-dependent methyltransferase